MKVLYFHQYFSTPEGSAGIRSYQMAKSLVKQGHEVTVVCGSHRLATTGLSSPFVGGCRSGCIDGINVIEFEIPYSNHESLTKRSWIFLKFMTRSIMLSMTRGYDIVCCSSTPLTVGVPGVFARWLRRKPFVFEVRDLWPELPRAMGVIRSPFVLLALSFLEWVCYRSAHRLIGLSPGIVEGIRKKGVSKENVLLSPNGCDLDIFEANSFYWRPKEVSPTDFLAVFAGAHGHANGLNALLDAAVILKRRGQKDIKIIMVGDGKLKPQLQERAKRCGLTNVIFHNPIEKEKLARLMSASNLGLQILANVPEFYYGTSPNKFFDYIAAGLPVVVNYPGWLADLIEENNCGFVVPPNNPNALADALEGAMLNHSLLSEMSGRAKVLAKESFDRNQLADIWVDWVVGANK